MIENVYCCGMPMKDISDFAANDPNKDYCVYCSRPTEKCSLLKRRREPYQIYSKNAGSRWKRCLENCRKYDAQVTGMERIF